eukprot:758023-Hanusia_phi.AAC.1
MVDEEEELQGLFALQVSGLSPCRGGRRENTDMEGEACLRKCCFMLVLFNNVNRKPHKPFKDKARAIESEIAQLIDVNFSSWHVLDNMPGKPGLNGRLVDPQGFPRSDVDVHTARIHRNRIACEDTIVNVVFLH